MTVVAYECYLNSEDDYTRESALHEHIASIRNHIRLLSRKNYHQLSSLCSLDYVLCLSQLTSILLELIKQPELVNEALRNKIMLS